MSEHATTLASTAMAAAREITGYIPTDWDPFYIAAKKKKILDDADVIQRHFQPLLAKVEGERDAALREKRAFFDKMNQINQWYAELIDVVYGELPEGINERLDPRTFVKARYDELAALRADLAAKEAALNAANDRWQKSSFREQQDIIDRLREQVAKADEDLLMDNQQLRESLLAKEANLQTANRIIGIVNAQAASRADKGGAT